MVIAMVMEMEMEMEMEMAVVACAVFLIDAELQLRGLLLLALLSSVHRPSLHERIVQEEQHKNKFKFFIRDNWNFFCSFAHTDSLARPFVRSLNRSLIVRSFVRLFVRPYNRSFAISYTQCILYKTWLIMLLNMATNH